MNLIHLQKHLGILLLYERKPWKLSQRRRPPHPLVSHIVSNTRKIPPLLSLLKSDSLSIKLETAFPWFLALTCDPFGVLKDQVVNSGTIFKPQGSISLSEVSFKSAVELPQEQSPPFFFTCQFSKNHNPNKKIGNSSEVHHQLSRPMSSNNCSFVWQCLSTYGNFGGLQLESFQSDMSHMNHLSQNFCICRNYFTREVLMRHLNCS